MTTAQRGHFNAIVTHRPIGENSGGVANLLKNGLPHDASLFALGNGLRDGEIEERHVNGNPLYVVGSNFFHDNAQDANNTLWPYNHRMPHRAGSLILSRDKQRIPVWDAAREGVARSLASAVFQYLQNDKDAAVNVHDYQITRFLRSLYAVAAKQSPELLGQVRQRIAVYYHHTPLFSLDHFNAADEPHQANLKGHIEDMLAYPAIGLQSPREMSALAELAETLFAAHVHQDGTMLHISSSSSPQNVALAQSLPIGLDTSAIQNYLADSSIIDSHRFDTTADHDYADRNLFQLVREEQDEGRHVFLRFGRADYSKNVPNNIEFFYHFATWLKDKHNIDATYLVCAQPTRQDIPEEAREMELIIKADENFTARWYQDGRGHELVRVIPEGVPREALMHAGQKANGYIDISEIDGRHLIPLEMWYVMGLAARQRKGPGGFVVAGANTGLGIDLIANNIKDGQEGMFVAQDYLKQTAYAAADAYAAGANGSGRFRAGERAVQFGNSNTLVQWQNLQFALGQEARRHNRA